MTGRVGRPLLTNTRVRSCRCVTEWVCWDGERLRIESKQLVILGHNWNMESDKDASDGKDKDPGQSVHPQGIQLMSLITKYFKTAGFLMSVWSLGYFRFSSSWILLALFFYISNEEFRKGKDAKRAFARDVATGSEQKAIMARVEELPAWVSSDSNLILELVYEFLRGHALP